MPVKRGMYNYAVSLPTLTISLRNSKNYSSLPRLPFSVPKIHDLGQT